MTFMNDFKIKMSSHHSFLIILACFILPSFVRNQKLNPTVDIVFKKLFGLEENKYVLLSFINSFLSQEHMLQDLEIINGYNMIHFKIDRLNLLEVEGRGFNNKRYRVNIELLEKGVYDRQGLEDWSTALSDRIEEDINFFDVYKGFGVHILYCDCVENSTNYHTVFPITEHTIGVQYFTDIELHTLELWKFNETFNGTSFDELAHQVQCPLDLWMLFLTKQWAIDIDNIPPHLKDDDRMFSRAMYILNTMYMDIEEMHMYDRHQNFLMPY